LDNLEKWLGPHLTGVRNSSQLQKLPWKDMLKNMVSVRGVKHKRTWCWLRLALWRRGCSSPDLSTQALLENLDKWLGPHLAGVCNSSQLQKLPWKDMLKGCVVVVVVVVGGWGGTPT
jgi:hypothetical protein